MGWIGFSSSHANLLDRLSRHGGGLDPSAYDLLASEARLASFIAIANGGAPTSHWFHLGRPMTPVGLGAALVSWSGSMFEYLMPALVMRSPSGSLLQQTYRLVVRRQMSYGAEHGVPWGVSESAYNVRDLDLTFQYSNFGVPGLGLERGLSENLVVAPYASALAAMVAPAAAARNLSRLVEVGARGPYGFYEALDYTGRDSRTAGGCRSRLWRTIRHDRHRARECALRWGDAGAVHNEPIIRATGLLLQAACGMWRWRDPVRKRCRRPHVMREFVEPCSVSSRLRMTPRLGRTCSRTGATR
jgi:cyclic beta-1,2-glucan synthetase